MRTSTVAAVLGLTAMAAAVPAPQAANNVASTVTVTVSVCATSGGASGTVKPTSATTSKTSQPTSGPGSPQSIKNMKDKIKKVVHIILENRSFDNILGGFTVGDIDTPANAAKKGIQYCNPVNTSIPNSQVWCSGPKDYDEIVSDPDHSVTGNAFQWYSTFHPSDADILSGKLVADNNGFVENQIRKYPKQNISISATQVMNYYLPDQVPVISSLVNNFVTFDKWFSCVPGPTNPNRLCHLSGTSAGHGKNDNDFNVHAIKINSIFQQLDSQNITWKNYDGTEGAFASDALFYDWTYQTGRNVTNVVPLEQFFQDAMLGQLPTYSYLNPSCCGLGTNSMHPNGPVSEGEVLLKQIYDVLRQGPNWEEMLLIVAFDESGGFHDHVPSPTAVRPDNLTYTELAPDGKNYTLTFDRLGGRMPQWIISPWVQKAHIEHEGVNAAGKTIAYSATSVLCTLGYLFDFAPFTARVEESPSFDHLIGTAMQDAPAAMPIPVPFTLG